jgi:Flp pilus assembly protein TadG
MRGLIRRRLERVCHEAQTDERGVTIVFVAAALAVLIGFLAFAVDVAALYQERRELQNGADAAAIAIAEDCARGSQPCTDPVATATAESYADANAGDGRSIVDDVELDTATRTVRVEVSTETADGGTVFRPFFAQVIGFDGTTVGAEASAAWGYLAGLETIPIIISDCEWERETNNGADLHEGDPPYSGDPSLLLFHTGNHNADDCAAQAGHDTDGDDRLPGGFGWLDTGGDCEASVAADGWVGEDPGSSPSNGCSAAELRDEILNQVVFIPYFRDVNGLGGANGEYEVAGFGALYVTGYNFGGQYKEPGGAGTPCNGAVRCLEGYFVERAIPDGDIGGEDRGVIVIKFTG